MNSENIYRDFGICDEVFHYCQKIADSLKERFAQIDETAEYNQIKVLRAMQEAHVSEACMLETTGYGYNDIGRDTLEEVYARTFHTEDALVRSQIVCGTHDGYFQEDRPVTEAIRGSGADVVFVCLGAPKQEKWMRKNGEATGAHLLVGLGGCLDVFSGAVQRAPEVFQRLGLEWLHRLAKNPSRIGRMMKLPLFLVHVGAERGKRK